MRDARANLQTTQVADRLNLAAIYGSLALIAAVVFGTLTFHPF